MISQFTLSSGGARLVQYSRYTSSSKEEKVPQPSILGEEFE
jgi:hypothetical protein